MTAVLILLALHHCVSNMEINPLEEEIKTDYSKLITPLYTGRFRRADRTSWDETIIARNCSEARRNVIFTFYVTFYSRVSQPGFRGTLGSHEMSLGVPQEIVIEKNKHSFLNLLAKINRSTEKYHSLLKIALVIIIGLLYLQLTDHANVP
jgi:hypothetical protein